MQLKNYINKKIYKPIFVNCKLHELFQIKWL